MQSDFINNFMTKLSFPTEAQDALSTAEETLITKEKDVVLSSLVHSFMVCHTEFDKILPKLDELASLCAIENYTMNLIFYLHCTPTLFEQYREKEIPEQIFWDSMYDFKCKLTECHEVKGIWGTFTATWFPRFFNLSRFALGRFQYEPTEFAYDTYTKSGFTVNKGDLVYNSHIPSAGPMPKEVRLDSYRRAYEFFKKDLKDKPIVIVCHSWLLFPGHKNFLPQKSNILDFMNDFDIIHFEENDTFDNIWRVFGKDHALPFDKLPRDTSLRRAYADHLISGGKSGNGFGILLFDGEKIL